MKITMAQINTTPNAFESNFNQIKFGVEKAIQDGSDIVVFPELAIPGYLIQDLIYNEGFVQKNYEYLNKICELTKSNKKLHVVVGYVDKNTSGSGKPFFNSAAVINNGFIIGKYNKWLFPYYDVFNEPRFFEPGKDLLVVKIGVNRCAISICEDQWNCKGQDDYNHHLNPMQKYRELNIDYMISLNASPYIINKPENRVKMLSEVCKNSFGLIYCNMYGSQDSLVFDGHSFVMNKNGALQAYLKNELIPVQNELAKGAKGQYETIDTDFNGFVCTAEEDNDLKAILLGLYDYVKKSGFNEVCFGSSAGIDSALVCALSAMVFGGDKVNCIMMPSIYSSEGSVSDAKQLHKNFGVKEYLVPIEHVSKIEHMNTHLGLVNYNKVADENYQARLRSIVSLHFSNATGALALNTSNKTELCCGYFSLGEIASFDVIGDLYKNQVYKFANRINEIYKKEMIPCACIKKRASAELNSNQFDEDSLMPYEILDAICQAYIEEYVSDLEQFKEYMGGIGKEQTIIKHEKVLEERYYKIVNLIDKMEFKRRLSPLCPKISRKAFGQGRMIPIVKK